MTETPDFLRRLPLDPLHRAAGAKFGAFAGYDMPIQYAEGLLAEHAWTRTHAGLFDVSHMGPCFLLLDPATAPADPQAAHEAVADIIETLCPSDIRGLKPGQIRYTTFLNAEGGVIDDLMVARHPDPEARGALYIVVNAGGKEADFALMEQAAGARARLERPPGMSLLALQGPQAAAVLAAHAPEAAELGFMHVWTGLLGGAPATISRSGYTGEDGFEILLGGQAEAIAQALLADPRVKPVGLGARDSLRLEAGLCLYGHDLDPTISPVEADLSWIMQKRRRVAGDFPGAERILRELTEGPKRRRVGILPLERAPAREGVEIAAEDGRVIGRVTSGGFGPTIGGPVSMGYVDPAYAAPGTPVSLLIRGQARPARIVALPFTPHRYVRRSPG